MFFKQTHKQTNCHEDKLFCAGSLPATLPTVYSLTAWALLKGGSLTVLTCKPLREERLETGLFMSWTPKEHLQKKVNDSSSSRLMIFGQTLNSFMHVGVTKPSC